MGGSGMNSTLSGYVKGKFADAKADLFSCFIERACQLAKPTGFTSLITMESWMFLSSFEKLREKINATKTIINMVHMPYLGKGGTSLGINFGTAAVVTKNSRISNYTAQYEYTVYYETDENGVPFVFPTINERWKTAKQENFSKIPGMPVAYWVSERFISIFDSPRLDSLFDAKTGLQTGDNNKYLKLWFEISHNDIDFLATKESSFSKKWFPHVKGGTFRKWYGNYEYVIYWKNNGEAIKSESGSVIRSYNHYFSQGITWSHTTSVSFSGRLLPEHFIINVESPSIFNCNCYEYIMGLLNSVVTDLIFKVMNSTFHYLVGNVATLPIRIDNSYKEIVTELVSDSIAESKKDWDSFETSWDFERHPLI